MRHASFNEIEKDEQSLNSYESKHAKLQHDCVRSSLSTVSSYFIVMVVWAYLKNEDMKTTDSDCGLNDIQPFTSSVG